MLLLVYRSVITVILVLFMVFLELVAGPGCRGVPGNTQHHRAVDIRGEPAGRRWPSRREPTTRYSSSADIRRPAAPAKTGKRRTTRCSAAPRTSSRVRADHCRRHVLLALHPAALLPDAGRPCAVGMLVVVVAALTLARRSSRGQPVRSPRPQTGSCARGWRRVGAAVVRWPGPVLVATLALALVGLLAVPGYNTSYDDRATCPRTCLPTSGYAAAEGHFSAARMNPGTADGRERPRLRNSADFLVIDKIAKASSGARVSRGCRAITRPMGTPIEHTTIPFIMGMQQPPADEPEVHAGHDGRHADADRRSGQHRHDEPRCMSITDQMAGHTQGMVEQDARHGGHHRRTAGPHLGLR